MVKTDKLTRSFRDAWQGVGLVFREGRIFRIHILAGVTAILVGVALGIPSVHFLILIVAISAVLSAELLNSALERFWTSSSLASHLMFKRLRISSPRLF